MRVLNDDVAVLFGKQTGCFNGLALAYYLYLFILQTNLPK